MAMNLPHRFTPGSVTWALVTGGVGIEGKPPEGTPGETETVRRVLAWFGPHIDEAATAHGVAKPLLVAVICSEAAGGQTDRALVCTARREEPGYISEASTPGHVSIGCCQTLLSTARAALREPALSAADLTNPRVSIGAAAAYIASQQYVTGFDPPLVAADYNAGGLHAEPTVTNRWGLRCYPLRTGRYIDTFVAWYNDAVKVLG